MYKYLLLIPVLALMCSCGEYNKVLKSRDVDYKFDYAKRAFDQRKFTQAATVLSDLIVPLRGGPKGEEALFLLGMSYFENKDYMNSGVNFKTYYSRYPKGRYAELARFYSGYGYYLDSPDPQLDQSMTVKAIEELQGFLDYFPDSDRVSIAQNAIFEMQDKLTLKELQNSQLYYNLGNFRGNNYQSAIITAQNALKNYPYSKYREDFELPQELHSAEEAVAYTESHPACWLKAPWSSSGRGVYPTAGLTREQTVQWARGIIRRQGSVMGEKNVERALDIATEWEIGRNKVSFIGFSCFHITGRGRYAGNIELPQEELIKMIGSKTDYPLYRTVEAQRRALTKIALGRYYGPCGIDMAVTTAGQIHPCFEINFRMTMGMATCMKTDRKRLRT